MTPARLLLSPAPLPRIGDKSAPRAAAVAVMPARTRHAAPRARRRALRRPRVNAADGGRQRRRRRATLLRKRPPRAVYADDMRKRAVYAARYVFVLDAAAATHAQEQVSSEPAIFQ